MFMLSCVQTLIRIKKERERKEREREERRKKDALAQEQRKKLEIQVTPLGLTHTVCFRTCALLALGIRALSTSCVRPNSLLMSKHMRFFQERIGSISKCFL